MKLEKLHMTVAIVTLIVSLITIFTFVTGTASIIQNPSPKPVVIVQPVEKPADTPATPETKKDEKKPNRGDSIGTTLSRVSKGANRALTLPHKDDDKSPQTPAKPEQADAGKS